MTDAALGFRVHTGWAAAVVIAGEASAPRVVDRRRFALVEKTDHDSVFVYHAAAELDAEGAQRLLSAATAVALRCALSEVARLRSDLASAGFTVCAVGLPTGAGRPLPGLMHILRSHSLIHSAEGALFRTALADASAAQAWPVVGVSSRELLQEAARANGLRPDAVRRQLTALGRTLGPPWAADQKQAALAAFLARAKVATTPATKARPPPSR